MDVVEKQSFDVMAVPFNRAFVVSRDKAEEFIAHKNETSVDQELLSKISEQIKFNNSREKGTVLKKVKGF